MVYRQITSAADHAILQQYLHKLARWEAEYSMEFHPHKCNVLRVTRSRSPSIFNYTLHGTALKSTESTQYLGDLTWGKHVDNIRAKANQQLAFVRRNIRTRSSSTKETLYNTLVRPHIEYAATVWNPHISKQKHSLEMVQRRAARWVTNRYHNTSSVSDMLHTLGWRSLEHRRATSTLCMLFQIYHGSIGIPHDPYILPYRHTPRPSRQTDNMHTLATYQCRTFSPFSTFAAVSLFGVGGLAETFPSFSVSGPFLLDFPGFQVPSDSIFHRNFGLPLHRHFCNCSDVFSFTSPFDVSKPFQPSPSHNRRYRFHLCFFQDFLISPVF